MKKIEVINKIKLLPVINKAENAWVDKKYQPFTLELVELNKVLEILYEKESHIKSVSQYTKAYKLKKTYNSVAEAALETGINRSSIYKCCGQKQLTAGGYIWKYYE